MIRKQNLARPTEGVSEAGSGLSGGTGGANGHATGTSGASGASGEELEDLTVLPADDPSLGLTNFGDVPPEDWAADTGPTRTAESSRQGVSDDLAEDERTYGGRRIDFDKPRK